MNLVYIGYWGANDGLSVSTIYPNLYILAALENVNAIYYFSIERDVKPVSIKFDSPKIKHIPLYSSNKIYRKVFDFVFFPKQIAKFAKENLIDRIICRGAPAGAIGYLIWKKIKIPYLVESFEPHAQYMLEANVWKRYDIRYLLESYWEFRQKETASFLMPVSMNYKTQLLSEGISKTKLKTVPCCVPLEKFKFNEADKIKIRQKEKIDNSKIVGIYVGKFGGIYYDKIAFDLFGTTYKLFEENFFLIILTPQNDVEIKKELLKRNLSDNSFSVKKVSHDEVPLFLSAADFAFSPIKESPSRKFCSPIKNGEYWANGLPILIPDGIGDDSDIIKNEGGGWIYDVSNPYEALKYVKQELHKIKRRPIIKLAEKYRNFDQISKVYSKLLLEKITL